MTGQERHGWVIAGALFAVLLLVFGSGYLTSGVFVTPLVEYFGWSRAKVAGLPALLAISAGVSAPLVGWLLDRLETRVVMGAGAIIAGASLMLASRANSYPPILVAYLLLGVGLTAATLLPASMVIANWFGARRGLAMGITMSGTTAGGVAMTLVASHGIARGGWRLGYQLLSLPMLLVATPLVWFLVRTSPHTEHRASAAEAVSRLPGLEVSDALRSRSFWMLSLANFCFAFNGAGGRPCDWPDRARRKLRDRRGGFDVHIQRRAIRESRAVRDHVWARGRLSNRTATACDGRVPGS
jgi:MFS family permease